MKTARLRKRRLLMSAGQAFVAVSLFLNVLAVDAAELNIDDIKSWRQVVLENNIQKKRVSVTTFSLFGGNKCSLLVLRPEFNLVRPGLALDCAKSKTAPTSAIVQEQKASFGVNGGYFNLSNGDSTSYVALNGAICADPTKNSNLTENPKLKPFLPQIFNRTEIRFLKAKGNLPLVQIASHNEPLPAGRLLDSSLQGGPRLLPLLNAEQEAFVRTEADGKQVDSIGVGRTAARTAVALTADGYLLILAVAGKGQDEFSSGLTLADLAKLLKNLGAVEALNLDGGTSTTMIQKKGIQQKEIPQKHMLIGRTPETRVRSALLVFE
ncbi:hypothetical protein BH11CYA1_BH11CYA1_37290 [soil metagenome]